MKSAHINITTVFSAVNAAIGRRDKSRFINYSRLTGNAVLFIYFFNFQKTYLKIIFRRRGYGHICTDGKLHQ
jgi:hypothetical protein